MLAGNITSKATYAYTVGTLPAQAVETSTYYYAAEWEDRLNRIVTTTAGGTQTQYIKYDPIGNPYVYDSFSLEWRGKQLTGITGDNGLQVAYSYNADGLRTQKVVGQTTYTYLWANGQLCRVTASVATDNGVSVSYADFIYDTNGTVSAMRYVSGNTDTLYYFVTTYAGDVAAIYSESGDMLAEFCYDAWGNFTYANAPTPGSPLDLSTFRYRGYIYDNETEFYYVLSRYYDSSINRWISADSRISGVSGNILGYNLFAYCMNNPVNMTDPTGAWPKWIENVANWVNNNIIQPIKEHLFSSKQSDVVAASSNDPNRRPYTGEPGSTYTSPNGDTRTYGPDGTPQHDYDHNDHGRPDKHPHDSNGGHNHDWENGVRGPAYSISWEPIAGATIATLCVIGLLVVVADDATGVGAVDDFLLVPLSTGIGEGLILIFG